MKYNIGDKVIIKTLEEMEDNYVDGESGEIFIGIYDFIPTMERSLDKNRMVTISNRSRDYYLIEEDGGEWKWEDEMIRCLARDLEHEVESKSKIEPIESRWSILDL